MGRASILKNIYKVMFIGMFGVFLALMGMFVYMGYETYKEYKILKRHEYVLMEELGDVNREVEASEVFLDRIKHDEYFLEWLVRQRLGLARANEIIFKFEE